MSCPESGNEATDELALAAIVDARFCTELVESRLISDGFSKEIEGVDMDGDMMGDMAMGGMKVVVWSEERCLKFGRRVAQ